MKYVNFEPFGEFVGSDENDGRSGDALLWIGKVIFWSLAVIIVIARVYYFQPFDGFDRVTKPEAHRHNAKIENWNGQL